MRVVELDGVRKRYGEVEALAGIDLAVDRGEVVALLGANGAGKTTAFEIMIGLVHPSTGTARVLGAKPGSAVRRRLGVMLQGAGLPEQMTVAELVGLVGHSYGAALPVVSVLDRVGLESRARRTVTALSGGERQRLLLAMAIVGSPELLLLDEPTAALDVESRLAFWAQARASVVDGATILFATHDLAEVEAIADRVVVLQEGHVLADATPEALRQRAATAVVRVATHAPPALLHGLPGVDDVQAGASGRGGPPRWRLRTADPAGTVGALFASGHAVLDLRVTDTDLEEAFLALTRGARPPSTREVPR